MIFAIRDDDTSYFTQVEDLENAYEDITDIPISLSVVPNSVSQHAESFPYGKRYSNYEQHLIGENKDLVEYLVNKIQTQKYEILMHGISHEYKKIEKQWMPEMLAFDFDKSFQELQETKKYLEDLFYTSIRVFVAPSNSLNKDAHKALKKLKMDTMGFLTRKIDHPLSTRYLWYWIKRNIMKIFGRELFEILSYKNYSEAPMFSLQDVDTMWKNYLLCKKAGCPFIIYTHYWHLNDCSEDKMRLKSIISMMIADGAEPRFVSECFKNNDKR